MTQKIDILGNEWSQEICSIAARQKGEAMANPVKVYECKEVEG